MVAPLCRVSATCSVLLLRDEKFIFEHGRDFLTTPADGARLLDLKHTRARAREKERATSLKYILD